MEIVCSADNNYVMPTGIMLTSLFENNKDEVIRVHLLDGGLTSESKKILMTLPKNIQKNRSYITKWMKVCSEIFQ